MSLLNLILLSSLAIIAVISDTSDMSAISNLPGNRCISIRAFDQTVYLVHDNNRNVFTDTKCSSKWAIDAVYPPDQTLCPAGICRVIKDKQGKVGRAPNAGTMYDADPIRDLWHTEGQGSWFIIRDNGNNGKQNILNVHRRSVNQNSLLCVIKDTAGNIILDWAPSSSTSCGWIISSTKSMIASPPNPINVPITGPTGEPTMVPTINPIAIRMSDKSDMSVLNNLPGNRCISIRAFDQTIYLVHDNNRNVFTDNKCSSKWAIDAVYPPDTTLCPGGICRVIKDKQGEVGRAPKAGTLYDADPIRDLWHTEGQGSWFIIRDNNKNSKTQNILNVHRLSVNQNSLLCVIKDTAGNIILSWAPSSSTACGWRISS